MNPQEISLTEISVSAAYIKHPEARVNILTFAGLRTSGGYGVPAYEFVKTLSSLKANVLFVRDISTRWYNFGLEDFSSDFHETAEIMQDLIDSNFGFHPLICIGNSMGGFASILYGELMRAKLAVAVCPQIFIGKAFREQAGEERWNDQFSSFEPSIPHLAPLLKGGCSKTLMIVGDRCVGDLIQAGSLIGCPNMCLQIEKGANHDVNKRWKEAGILIENYQKLIFSHIS